MGTKEQPPTIAPPPRSQSLRRRLMALLGGIASVTLLVIGSSVFFFISQSEQLAWQGRQREAARYAGETVATFIQRTRDSLTMASLLGRNTLETEPQVMRDFLKQNPALLEIIRLDQGGRVIASTYQDSPVMANLFTIPQSNWFLKARADGFYLSGIQISASDDPYMIIAISAPDGGVAAARLRMDTLWKVVAEIQFGESGQAYVVDQTEEVIAHTRPDVALARTSLEERPEMIALSHAPSRVWHGSYRNFEGVRVVGVTAPVPGTDWVVITELPQSEALATSRTALLILGTGLGLFGILMLWGTARFLRQLIIQPLERLRTGAARIGQGDVSHRIDIARQDEVGQLATAFNQMVDELQDLYQQIAARTRDLERRARYLEATAVVARDATSVLNLQELLARVVTLISERFGFYHAGIFLTDPTGDWTVLQAASSEGGRRMLARGHRLRVGQEGIVGYVAGRGEPRIVLDVDVDAVFYENPDLPETRSEMALPLRVRGKIIGALDVQSLSPETFSSEDVAVLQTLADQLAVAINNAQLFQQAQESLEAERRAYGELSRQAWRELLRAHPALGFLSDRHGTAPAIDLEELWAKTVLQTGETALDENGARNLAVPIKIWGQVIGIIDAHKPDDAGEWTADEVALMETLTEQLGLALESARLYQDTRRRAAHERLISEATTRMRETLDVETVLKTAAEEIFQALDLSELEIRMTKEEPDNA